MTSIFPASSRPPGRRGCGDGGGCRVDDGGVDDASALVWFADALYCVAERMLRAAEICGGSTRPPPPPTPRPPLPPTHSTPSPTAEGTTETSTIRWTSPSWSYSRWNLRTRWMMDRRDWSVRGGSVRRWTMDRRRP